MPIAKMSALITSVGTFICTCTFSSVPSTKCNVYFVSFFFYFFSLFITQTTPICNQKGGKSKNHPRSFSRWLEERLCLHVFVYFQPSILQSLALLQASAILSHTFTPFNVSLIPQWIKARLNCHDFMRIFIIVIFLPSRFSS